MGPILSYVLYILWYDCMRHFWQLLSIILVSQMMSYAMQNSAFWIIYFETYIGAAFIINL